jgi:FkbM family methyltransferase
MPVPEFLRKPEFWFRPTQFLHRLIHRLPRGNPEIILSLPWGLPLRAHARENIGKQVFAFGLFELPVCETIFRLVDPGDVTWDVGANIGHMTSVLAVRAGVSGQVHAFEPHPDVHPQLHANIQSWKSLPNLAPIHLHAIALSNHTGSATLFDAPDTSINCGLGSLLEHHGMTRRFSIQTAQLDQLLAPSQSIQFLKLDVEGAEISVLEGARQSLAQGRIRDILFEDHRDGDSPTARFLATHGYHLFSIGVQLRGPWIGPDPSRRPPLRPWDSPNRLATLDPERALARMNRRGWDCLRSPVA